MRKSDTIGPYGPTLGIIIYKQPACSNTACLRMTAIPNSLCVKGFKLKMFVGEILSCSSLQHSEQKTVSLRLFSGPLSKMSNILCARLQLEPGFFKYRSFSGCAESVINFAFRVPQTEMQNVRTCVV